MADPEVIIVGAGPAGIATALFLAAARPQLAERIQVLDRERFPREKPCAGAVGGRALTQLASIGVQVEAPGVPIDGISIATRFGAASRSARGIGQVVRRFEFDHALLRAARSRGIQIEEGVKVSGLSARAGGVTLITSTGERRARVVVGADGVGSAVRRALGLPRGELYAQAVEVDTEMIPEDGPRTVLNFDACDPALAGYSWDFPTRVDGKDLWCRGSYALQVGDDGRDVGALLDARLRQQNLDPTRYKHKRYALRGLSRHEPCARPGVILVGEAAGVDPLFGEGIAQAIGYGSVAGPYLADKLASGSLAFDDWAHHLGRSPLGRDLAARVALVEPSLGRSRAWVERALVAAPEVMDLLLARFAGQPMPLRSAGLALRSGGAALAHRGTARLRSWLERRTA